MNFKTPSFTHYISSLLAAVVITGLVYALLKSLNVVEGKLIFMAIGLLIGHLVGIVTIPSIRISDNKRKSGTKSAGDSEIISLYVGNIAYSAKRDSISKLFGQYGKIKSVRIMTDRETRRPRGYGFIEMEGTGALTAIKQLDGKEFCGRTLKVSEANQK